MSRCTINLPPDLDEFVMTSIASGRYESVSELVQAALRIMNRKETAAEEACAVNVIADSDVFRKLWEASAQSSPFQRQG
jgi:putative addiction module CopG family antidote